MGYGHSVCTFFALKNVSEIQGHCSSRQSPATPRPYKPAPSYGPVLDASAENPFLDDSMRNVKNDTSESYVVLLTQEPLSDHQSTAREKPPLHRSHSVQLHSLFPSSMLLLRTRSWMIRCVLLQQRKWMVLGSSGLRADYMRH